MLTLSRKQMTVLCLIMIAFIIALTASLVIIHAASPHMWQHVQSLLPDVVDHT